MSSSILKTWLAATRPKTLPLAIACIFCGSTIAINTAHFSIMLMILAIVTALLLQILSNLANDYGDTIKGTDNEARLGPKRASQLGLIAPDDMKKALFFNTILTALVGLTLVFTAFNNISDIISFLILGALAILAAICYTVGKKPYGYYGFGDLSVLIFFGWLGVAGTFYLQSGTLNAIILLPSTACGLLAVCVLNINNLRDIENDFACGKHTLVVKIGPKWGRAYHLFLLVMAFICFTLFALIEQTGLSRWLFLLALPFAIIHGKNVWLSKNGQDVAPMMKEALQIAFITNILFSLGVLIDPYLLK